LTANWELDDQTFQETRPLLAERVEPAAWEEDWGDYNGPMDPENDPYQ